jgi:hypothetical protein
LINFQSSSLRYFYLYTVVSQWNETKQK